MKAGAEGARRAVRGRSSMKSHPLCCCDPPGSASSQCVVVGVCQFESVALCDREVPVDVRSVIELSGNHISSMYDSYGDLPKGRNLKKDS